MAAWARWWMHGGGERSAGRGSPRGGAAAGFLPGEEEEATVLIFNQLIQVLALGRRHLAQRGGGRGGRGRRLGGRGREADRGRQRGRGRGGDRCEGARGGGGGGRRGVDDLGRQDDGAGRLGGGLRGGECQQRRARRGERGEPHGMNAVVRETLRCPSLDVRRLPCRRSTQLLRRGSGGGARAGKAIAHLTNTLVRACKM